MMHLLDETSCTKGAPLRSLWTADEARMVKRILNNLTVRQRSIQSTEIERDPDGNWTIWIPIGGGGSSIAYYKGYFAVNDSTSIVDGVPVYRVTVSAGVAVVNGVRVDCDSVSFAAAPENIVLSIWCVGYISANGVRSAGVENSLPEDNEEYAGSGGVLVATVVRTGNVLTITQQLHGEAQIIIWGDCGEENS